MVMVRVMVMVMVRVRVMVTKIVDAEELRADTAGIRQFPSLGPSQGPGPC